MLPELDNLFFQLWMQKTFVEKQSKENEKLF